MQDGERSHGAGGGGEVGVCGFAEEEGGWLREVNAYFVRLLLAGPGVRRSFGCRF